MKSEIVASGLNYVDLAYKYFEELKQLRGAAYVIFLRVGEIAYEIKEKKLFKHLGYDSMKEMLADPEINAFAEQTVKDYMSMYKKYSLEMEIDSDVLLRIGPGKLKIISGRVKENPEEWLDKAEHLSRSDLITEVRGEDGRKTLAPSESLEKPLSGNSPLALTVEQYYEWVKTQPCCVCGAKDSSFAHWPVTRQNTDFGIPLCIPCHSFQESNQIEFFRLYRRNVAKYLEGLLNDQC